MTSIERHEARYQRRKHKRDLKKEVLRAKTFDEVFSFENIYKAAKKCCNNSRWKSSVINFENKLLLETQRIYDEIRQDERHFIGFNSFSTIEHGKLRNIDALPIKERAAQKCLCQNILSELYSKSFIYENSASLKGKGMDFALRQLKKQLSHHYRKYGLEGGIYQFDFKNYFASLPHSEIKRRIKERFKDERLQKLFCSYVDDFQQLRIKPAAAHGIGLGSEVSQIIALDYTSPIDHYIKNKCKIKGYGRYMDDGYIISNSLTELNKIKEEINLLARKLGIRINQKKNTITPFKHHSFSFLKMKISLTPTGKILFKLNKQSTKAMKRKIRIFHAWFKQHKMSAEDIIQSYQSWRAHAKRCNSYQILTSMDNYFYKYFQPQIQYRKNKFCSTIPLIKTNLGWICQKEFYGVYHTS